MNMKTCSGDTTASGSGHGIGITADETSRADSRLVYAGLICTVYVYSILDHQVVVMLVEGNYKSTKVTHARCHFVNSLLHVSALCVKVIIASTPKSWS